MTSISSSSSGSSLTTRFRLVVVRDFADVGSGVTPLDGAADTCRLERRTGALFSTNRGILAASMSRTVGVGVGNAERTTPGLTCQARNEHVTRNK